MNIDNLETISYRNNYTEFLVDRVVSRTAKKCKRCKKTFFYNIDRFATATPYKKCVHCAKANKTFLMNEWFLMTLPEKILMLFKRLVFAGLLSIFPLIPYVLIKLIFPSISAFADTFVLLLSFSLAIFISHGNIRKSIKRGKDIAYLKKLLKSGVCNEKKLNKIISKLQPPQKLHSKKS